MNNKGTIPIQAAVVILYAGAMLGAAITDTVKDGSLKKNGQTIWCKMQNKGDNYCNLKYGYNPETNRFE